MGKDTRAGDGRRAAFLAGLGRGLSVTGAAAAAGVNRTLIYKWQKEPDFASAVRLAEEAGSDLLEDEALRRALDGVEKPVFWRGEQVGTVRTYNDRLLMLLLQRRRPVREPDDEEKYEKQRSTDIALQTLLDFTLQYVDQRTACEGRITELTHALNEARQELAAATGAAAPEPLPVVLPYDKAEPAGDDEGESEDGPDAADESPAAAAAEAGGADGTSAADERPYAAATGVPDLETAVLSVSKCLPADARASGRRDPESDTAPDADDEMPDNLRRLYVEVFGGVPPALHPGR